jgi:hypothetical protein
VKPLLNFLVGLVLVGVAASGAMAGCGSSGNSGSPADAGLVVFPDGGGGTFVGDDGGGDASGQPLQGTLAITPLTPTVAVTAGQPLPTLPFTATVGGVQTGVAWGIDRGELGTISSSGVFTPSGNLGGVGTITAVYGSQKVTTTITVTLSVTQQGDPAWMTSQADGGAAFDGGAGGYGGVGGDGPGAAPTPGNVTTLGSMPTADPGVSILYPYDKTVWPQGLLAPLLQWNAGSHAFDSVYVRIKETNYEYQGYFAANKAPFLNLPVPEPAWDAATLSNGGEPMTVSLTFGQGAAAYGPYTETWTIAQGTLQGTIYYNSYGTALVTNSDVVDPGGNPDTDFYGKQYGAATLAILPGATAPTLVAGVPSPGDGTGCRVCHTVSADGKSLLTQASTFNANDYSKTEYVDLANFTMATGGTPLSTPNLAFPAVYKDGSLLLSGSGGMINGDQNSRLYTMPAGMAVAATTGLSSNLQATLPAFSPDGKHVSFNFWGGTMQNGTTTLNGDQKSLGLLDFDGVSAFSNPRVPYTPASGTSVTYSSFLPNSAGVAFEIELANATGSWAFTWGNGNGSTGNTGELWWLDTASGMAHRLDQLNGYASGAAVYLPGNQAGAGAKTHTAAQDATVNYEPTVNPIATGGYAWVVFTSRRMYGNVAQLAPWTSDPRKYAWLDQITDKKLWVAAVDLNAPPGTDPSHPAFYLPGQEIHAGNSRGYWSVEACVADGTSCKTGAQCCGGYCQPSGDGGLNCSSQMPACSAQYDKCMTDSDCCGAQQGITCINHVCSVSQPPAK